MKNYKIVTSLALAVIILANASNVLANEGTTEEEVKARYNFVNGNPLTKSTDKINTKMVSSIISTKSLVDSTTVNKVVAFNKERVYLHNSPNADSKTNSSVNSQYLNVIRQNGNFIEINTWLGPKWIYNENNNIEVFSVIPFRRQMLTYERVSLHDQPFAPYKRYESVAPQTLQILERAGDDWYKISSFVGEKWIHTTMGTISEPPVPKNVAVPKTSDLKGKVTASTLNVRSLPSTSGKVLGGLSNNKEVDIFSVDNTWATIMYNGQWGYVSTTYLNIFEEVSLNPRDTDDKYLLYSKSRLNLYSKPSKEFPIGTSVTPQVLSSSKRVDKYWYEIDSATGKAYVNMEESTGGYATDKILDLSGELTLTSRSDLYLEPFETHPIGASLSPQNVKYIAKTNGYRLIPTWLGNRWVKVPENTYPVVEEKPDTGSYTLMTSSGPINYKDANQAKESFNKISDKDAYLLSNGVVIDMKSGLTRTNAFTVIYDDNGVKSTYVSTNTEFDVRYVTDDKIYVNIADEKGYFERKMGEIIPYALAETKRSSFRKHTDGKTTHRIYDGDTSYYDLKVGYAPPHLSTGVFEYTFNPRNIGNQDSYQYFMYLPLRQSASYTAAEIDAFIKKSSPDSPLIGTGKYFVEASNKYNLNVGYFVAHAIHESAWGKSKIALEKKNLFGFQAVDSNPYDGAAAFKTLEEGIHYCADYISKNYINTPDWKYQGGFVGDKAAGMNVYYASDPYWGEKIAGIMHRLDSMYNNRELNKYPLGEIASGVSIYTMDNKTPVYQKKLKVETFALKLGTVSTSEGTFYKITADDASYKNNIYIKAADFREIKSY